MDSHIDLTTNMDFGNRRVNPSVPRSIFSKITSGRQMHTIPSVTYMTGTNLIYNVGNSLMGNMNYEYRYDDTCDRCGADISRIPWFREIYYNLCKRCTLDMETKRIPWR